MRCGQPRGSRLRGGDCQQTMPVARRAAPPARCCEAEGADVHTPGGPRAHLIVLSEP